MDRPYRTTAGITAVVLGMVAGVWLLVRLRALVVLILVAGLIAAALDRPVNWAQARFRLRRRGSAVAIIGAAAVAGLIGVLFLVALPVSSQAGHFRDRLPTQVERLKTLPLVGQYLKKSDLRGSTDRFLRDLPDRFGNSDVVLGVAQTAVTGLAIVATTLVAAVFLLLKGPVLADGAAELIVTPSRRERIRRMCREVQDAVAGYVIGNLLISFLAALVVVISLELMRAPFVAVLAVVMFLLDLLPLVGATLGGLVVTLATFVLDPHPWKALVFIVVFVVYQQIESHTLYPVIMGRTVKIGPISIFFITLAGAELGGILGALLAIPAGAVLNIVLREVLEERRRRVSPVEAGECQLDP